MQTARIAAAALLLGGLAWTLGADRAPRPAAGPAAPDPRAVADIAAAYGRDIEPLFKRACFDCHSGQTRWPWYHALPGVKQLLEHHVEEGREHLDLEGGFPFKGEDGPAKTLRHIAEEVEEGGMPLFSYRLLHSEARLSAPQREAIVRWAREGARRLEPAGPGAEGGAEP